MKAGVFDLETPVLDDPEAGVACLGGCCIVAQSELEPDDFGPDLNCFIDYGGYGVGSSEDIDYVGDLREIAERRITRLAQHVVVSRVDGVGAKRRADQITTELTTARVACVRSCRSGEKGMMRSDAYLINTSRAAAVDEDALVRALTAGTIAGAAIDVYEHEPLPSDHRLRTTPRLMGRPHIGSVTRETYEIFYRRRWRPLLPIYRIEPGVIDFPATVHVQPLDSTLAALHWFAFCPVRPTNRCNRDNSC